MVFHGILDSRLISSGQRETSSRLMHKSLVKSVNGVKPFFSNKGKPKPPKVNKNLKHPCGRLRVDHVGRYAVRCSAEVGSQNNAAAESGSTARDGFVESEDGLILGGSASGASNVLDVALGYGSTLAIDGESTVAAETEEGVLVAAVEAEEVASSRAEPIGFVGDHVMPEDHDEQEQVNSKDENKMEDGNSGTVLGVALGTAGTLPVLDEIVAPKAEGEVTSSQELARATAPVTVPDLAPSKEGQLDTTSSRSQLADKVTCRSLRIE